MGFLVGFSVAYWIATLDNEAAIYELSKAESTQKYVLDAHNALLQLLCNDGTTCDIRWVRDHGNVLGNELADEAAKIRQQIQTRRTSGPNSAVHH